MTNPQRRRQPRAYDDQLDDPMLLPISGWRDQTNRITYLPWSDVRLGAIGWEVYPDRSTSNVLVYIVPMADETGLEIRCHAATQEFPDPTKDVCIGHILIPLNILNPEAPR